ncbi:MAG: iron-sulfur cluster assembly scaffold protein [Deltaproteobacteria bacterium]|nr:iron-sulfur cluster assembly scaffold protein [Deltaproteobacteria bacterium]
METETKDKQKAAEVLRQEGYSEKVIDHWLNPRNIGRGNRKKCDGYSDWYTGPCGDSMEICLTVRNNVISRATFFSDICIGVVSSASALTEMLQDMTVSEAAAITSDDLLEELGGLPDHYIHCAELAVSALSLAIRDYLSFAREPWKKAYL